MESRTSAADTDETTGRLADQLLWLTRRLHRAQRRHLEPVGVTPAQARMLRTVAHILKSGPAPRMADLAERLDVVPRAVTSLTDALEERGSSAGRPTRPTAGWCASSSPRRATTPYDGCAGPAGRRPRNCSPPGHGPARCPDGVARRPGHRAGSLLRAGGPESARQNAPGPQARQVSLSVTLPLAGTVAVRLAPDSQVTFPPLSFLMYLYSKDVPAPMETSSFHTG